MNGDAAAAAETAARHSYGRLLAWLAWQWRDVAAAEDALAEAFARALACWPRDGVPDAPDAWLMTAAKRQLLVAARRQRLADDPTLTVLWPDEPEALGLLALLSLCEARRPARSEVFQPLHEQDTRRWDAALIARANDALLRAAARRAPGPYQLEAAIQAAHVQGRIDGEVPWDGIVRLYERLLEIAPTVGAQIAHAVAAAHARDARAGLRLLDEIEPERIASHQPWWAARAHLLAMDGAHAESATAYGRALALTVEPRLRDWLASRLAEQSAAG